MSWQAFSWHEITNQARGITLSERLQPAIDWTGNASTEALRFIAAFLTPLALTGATLGFWRLSSDMGWTGEFFVQEGMWSHWQVWLALALGTQVLSVSINRRLKNQSAAHEIRQ